MKRQAGFTLVEIAIVMVIVGLLLVATLTVFNTVDKRAARNTTIQRMEVIMDALSAFASRNYRIPCPADPRRITTNNEPFGAEWDSGPNGVDIVRGCTDPNEADGIVPFAALQLGEEDVRDGWGNYITYKVNPDFTADPENINTDVHALCRTSEWIEGPRNKAAEKARFCCTGENRGTEIVVCQNPAANSVGTCNTLLTGRIWGAGRDGNNLLYTNNVNALAAPDSGPAPFNSGTPYYRAEIYRDVNIETIAYALISHGENEDGAFLNTGGRIGDTNADTIPDSGGTHEILNADRTQVGVWALPQVTTNDANYFDDIVRFSTQGMVLARLRKDSCAVP